MTVTIVGAISAKGVLNRTYGPLKVGDMHKAAQVFYLSNFREVTIKGRKGNPDTTIYEGDVLDIEGKNIGTVRLDTEPLMTDVDTLVAFGSEQAGIPEDEAVTLTYGPLRIVRAQRNYHLSDADTNDEG